MNREDDPHVGLLQRMDEIAAGTRYTREALMLVWDAACTADIGSTIRPQISAREVCWRFRDLVIMRFREKALSELHTLGIRSCDDIGRMVKLLTDAGLVAKSNADQVLDDIHGVYDFDVEFHPDAIVRDFRRPIQWRLSTILLATTAGAIAAAGFANLGLNGAVAAVFASWLGFIGVCCIWLGIRERSQGWAIALVLGCGILAAALAAFLLVVMK